SGGQPPDDTPQSKANPRQADGDLDHRKAALSPKLAGPSPARWVLQLSLQIHRISWCSMRALPVSQSMLTRLKALVEFPGGVSRRLGRSTASPLPGSRRKSTLPLTRGMNSLRWEL